MMEKMEVERWICVQKISELLWLLEMEINVDGLTAYVDEMEG